MATLSIRAGAHAAAAVLATLLVLVLAGSARAERPGWYSIPSITGSAGVGATLVGSDGGLSCIPGCAPDGPEPARAGVAFEWISCAGSSPGGADRPTGGLPDDPREAPGCVSRGAPSASATSYVVRQDDAGRYVQLHVHATNYDCGEWNYSTNSRECRYSTAHGYSPTVGPIGGSAAPPPPPTSATDAPSVRDYPTTSGLAKEGATLTAANGSWTSVPTSFAYQWKRCAPEFEPCAAIAGATRSSYVLTADDVGQRVQVLVTASNAKGSNAAASFPTDIVATTAVAPANTALPAVSGVVEDRQRLTVTPGTWSGTLPIAFTYQWQHCSTGLGGCVPIPGATTPTFAVGREELGNRMLVTVTATNRAGSATATSAPTQHVVAAKPRPGSDRLAIEDVDAPNALVLADVRLGRTSLAPRGTVTVTARVTDRHGFKIEGARVTVTGPGGAVLRGAAVATDGNGIATIRVRAGAKLPKRTLVLTVTATKPGEAAVSATKRVSLAVRQR